MLMSLVLVYWPDGADARILTPTMVRRGSFANSRGSIAGLPRRLTENFRRVSANPLRDTAPACSPTRPVTSAQEAGIVTLARAKKGKGGQRARGRTQPRLPAGFPPGAFGPAGMPPNL